MSEEEVPRITGEIHADPAGGADHELVGGFAYNRSADRWSWSPPVYRMHGFEPHDVVPTTELLRFHLHADDRERVIETLWQAMEARASFSHHFRLVDAHGQTRTVLALGTGLDGGSPATEGLRGQLVDLSPVHDEMLREDLEPVVEDFRLHRAVIEQAKGIVMQMMAVDADEAFLRLRRFSQETNIKVRVLAQLVVDAASQDRTPVKGTVGLTLSELFGTLDAGDD